MPRVALSKKNTQYQYPKSRPWWPMGRVTFPGQPVPQTLLLARHTDWLTSQQKQPGNRYKVPNTAPEDYNHLAGGRKGSEAWGKLLEEKPSGKCGPLQISSWIPSYTLSMIYRELCDLSVAHILIPRDVLHCFSFCCPCVVSLLTTYMGVAVPSFTVKRNRSCFVKSSKIIRYWDYLI